ncbi:hypothetical protein [Planctomyces sp. SH-PL14]|uniref:hypothetical protein n=1 Tax=Planctomyces sp. SH-PL14 TaxID=1632864 RepID=UPI00078C63BF|nr:hypothetical protein [Planctomyces sp. SH-PL14]AMV20328.1 hypothetical protein VT03_20690 [Planctomyces sp. SH-PL14]
MDAIVELIGLFASLFMMLIELVFTLLVMLFQGLAWVFVRCVVPVYDRAVDRLHARHRAARDARSAGPSHRRSRRPRFRMRGVPVKLRAESERAGCGRSALCAGEPAVRT